MLTLARAPDDRLSFKDIAESEDIPRDYLAKILRTLVDADLIDSKRGANGGYRLCVPVEDLTFLQVIEAADSPVAVNLCTEFGSGCTRSTDCALACVWRSAEEAMRKVFAGTTIADILGGGLSGLSQDVPVDALGKPSVTAVEPAGDAHVGAPELRTETAPV